MGESRAPMTARTELVRNGVEPPDDQESGRGRSEDDQPRRWLRLGVEGGAIATAVMTLFRGPITDSLPPTAAFWATYVGTAGPEEYPVQALLLHVLYGMGAATVFAVPFELRARGSDHQDERRGTFWATLYGLGLSVFGTRVVLGRLLGMDLDPDERWIFHVSHAIYGLTLGAWLGSKT